ncbi:MAG: hypothetical protein KatS3mg119_1443 [Rhodothalassiaceae bacterium]|nr:MAG: hypothetical protein KatS3mg119_1443 [Rhodothalassiaceae bacterium]
MRGNRTLFLVVAGAIGVVFAFGAAAALATWLSLLTVPKEDAAADEGETGATPVESLFAFLGLGPTPQQPPAAGSPQTSAPPAGIATPIADPVEPVTLEEAVAAAKAGGPEDIKTLGRFFDASGGDIQKLRERVVQLLDALSQDPGMQDPAVFATRAADIVELANRSYESAYLYRTRMRVDLMVKEPALGFDLGPEGRPAQPGFTRVHPGTDWVNRGTSALVTDDGPAVVSDGLMNITSFDHPFEDGNYRVTLITLPEGRNITPYPFGTSVQASGTAVPIKDALNTPRKLYATLRESDFFVEDFIPEMPNDSEEVSAVALSVPVKVSGGNLSILLNPADVPTYVTAIVVYPEEEQTVDEKTAERIADILARLAPAAGQRPGAGPGFDSSPRTRAAPPGDGGATGPNRPGRPAPRQQPGPPQPPISQPGVTTVPPPAPANTLQAVATGPAEVLLGETALLNGCDTLFNGEALAAAFGSACESGALTGFTAEWFFNGELIGTGFLFNMATGPGTPFDVPGLYEITLLVTFFGDGTTPILTSVATLLIRVVAQAPIPEPEQLILLLAGLLGILLWHRRRGRTA